MQPCKVEPKLNVYLSEFEEEWVITRWYLDKVYKFLLWRLAQTDTLTGRTPNPDCYIFLSEVKTRLLCLLLHVQIHSACIHAWATLHSTRFSALVYLQILDRGHLLADRTVNLITPKWKPNQIWMCFTLNMWPSFLGGMSTITLYHYSSDKGHFVLCYIVHVTCAVVN